MLSEIGNAHLINYALYYRDLDIMKTQIHMTLGQNFFICAAMPQALCTSTLDCGVFRSRKVWSFSSLGDMYTLLCVSPFDFQASIVIPPKVTLLPICILSTYSLMFAFRTRTVRGIKANLMSNLMTQMLPAVIYNI